jgi:hypothetical protein
MDYKRIDPKTWKTEDASGTRITGEAVKGKEAHFREAEPGEKVITITSDGEETRNTADAGDKIATGPNGEEYIVTQDKFEDLYGDWDGPGDYRPKQKDREFFYVYEPVVLEAPWGEDQKLDGSPDNPAVVMMLGEDDRYGVGPDEFEKTYDVKEPPTSDPVATFESDHQKPSGPGAAPSI